MAAAPTASASTAYLCSYASPHRPSLPSSSSNYFQTHFPLKPISSRGFCFCLPKNANIPVINNNSSRRCRFLKASQSQSEDSAAETDDEDETPLSKTEEEADQELPSRLESTISAYKEAILNGDEKSISDFEEIIHMVEKERNELLEKVSVLSDEIGAQKDKYVRLQADFDNFRKRTENEKLTIRSNAQGEVIESLLPMVDNFERAKQHIKLETEQEKKIDASYQGIYKQFVEIMKNLGVSVVPTVGTLFDPMLHEAIAQEESEEFKEGVIIEEFRRGFLLVDRLLRPAMVKVSSGPGVRQPSSAASEQSEQPATAGVEEIEFSEQSTG
ncbi:uncharacterized protein LOC113760330 [Coffea eugenioides]|uniref:uncharacterized protein LOC113760330 n=1 Tax=Coffea eugenioides TaxID=49369 RepID=UPI000F60E982|nr:uncharacterized protein LOC113760330 [Coffea eugenioides]